MSPFHRKQIHILALRMGMRHRSEGKRRQRFITVSKRVPGGAVVFSDFASQRLHATEGGVAACRTGVTRGTGLGAVLGARTTPRRLAICRLACVASARLIGSVALELARARTDCLHPLGQDVSKDEARGRDTSELEGHGHVALLHPCRMLIVITTPPPGLGTLDGCRQTPR